MCSPLLLPGSVSLCLFILFSPCASIGATLTLHTYSVLYSQHSTRAPPSETNQQPGFPRKSRTKRREKDKETEQEELRCHQTTHHCEDHSSKSAHPRTRSKILLMLSLWKYEFPWKTKLQKRDITSLSSTSLWRKDRVTPAPLWTRTFLKGFRGMVPPTRGEGSVSCPTRDHVVMVAEEQCNDHLPTAARWPLLPIVNRWSLLLQRPGGRSFYNDQMVQVAGHPSPLPRRTDITSYLDNGY